MDININQMQKFISIFVLNGYRNKLDTDINQMQKPYPMHYVGYKLVWQ